jgi:Ca2+-binding EF-hand superfamily protein
VADKKKKTTNNAAGLRVLDEVSHILENYIAKEGGSVFECFEVIDAGDDNFIQPEEFLTAMKNLGAKNMTSSDIKLLFQVVDDNNDGRISYGEFSKYVG